jgi:ketosteroid isomerase-like protein
VKPSLLLFACLMSSPVMAQASPKDTGTPVNQIEAVIEDFRSAIITKDKDRFVKLLLHEDITWQSVMNDESLQRIRQKNSNAAKVEVNRKNNPITFIDGIVAGKHRIEEKFSNIRIDTDGDVASVYFDYSFHVDGRETNHGKEAWHLVNTEAGWKLVSVVWSKRLNPAPK